MSKPIYKSKDFVSHLNLVILGSIARISAYPITHAVYSDESCLDNVLQVIDINKAFPTHNFNPIYNVLNTIKLRDINTGTIVYANEKELTSLDCYISPFTHLRSCMYKNKETSIREILYNSHYGSTEIFDKYHE